VEKGAVAIRERGRVSNMREMLNRATSGGLSPAERIVLRGQVACLAAKVARLNADLGREVAALSPMALGARDGASATAFME
jgi:hypothetical protein